MKSGTDRNEPSGKVEIDHAAALADFVHNYMVAGYSGPKNRRFDAGL